MIKDLTVQRESILPILVYIQTHLDSDLSLERITARAGFSPFHFHRVCHEAVSETLKEYTLRLRLERAAFLLKINTERILDIAHIVGFQSHETFTRAFQKYFGEAPQNYRKMNKFNPAAIPAKSEILNEFPDTLEISRVSVQKLKSLRVVFMRHLGSYLEVDLGMFDELVHWAKREGLYTGSNLLLGIGHDDPNITEESKLRFDACMEVSEPIRQNEEGIGYQMLEGQLTPL